MKRTVVLIICFALSFLVSCVEFSPIKIDSVVESQDPKMTIDLDYQSEENRKNNYGCVGTLLREDGTEIEIRFVEFHKNFTIYENVNFDEEGLPSTDTPVLYSGTCKQKGNTLILFLDDGGEIRLTKVG